MGIDVHGCWMALKGRVDNLGWRLPGLSRAHKGLARIDFSVHQPLLHAPCGVCVSIPPLPWLMRLVWSGCLSFDSGPGFVARTLDGTTRLHDTALSACNCTPSRCYYTMAHQGVDHCVVRMAPPEHHILTYSRAAPLRGCLEFTYLQFKDGASENVVVFTTTCPV